MINNLSRIQYISQGTTLEQQGYHIHQALDYGAKWIQIRWKWVSPHDVLQLAQRVKMWCQNYEATLIINDYVKVALEVDADGVHLGLNDGSVGEARSILGNSKIIGGTANTVEDVQQRIQECCDYIGLGPFRFTSTKDNLSPVLGIAGYERILDAFKHSNYNIPPIYAIGGLALTDIPSLINIGIYGVAMSSLISHQPTIIEKIKTYYER